MPKISPAKRRTSQITQARILSAAERLFAKKGFDKTRIREIARESGANVAMVYYYFGNKEDLYWAILEYAAKKLNTELQKAASMEREEDPAQALFRIIEVYLNFFSQHPQPTQILFREVIDGGSRLALISEKYIGRDLSIITNLIEKGIEKGIFKPLDARWLALDLIGVILVYFGYRPIYNRLFPPQDREKLQGKELANHIYDLLLGALTK
jgi:AcrR family transcriptional regulator